MIDRIPIIIVSLLFVGCSTNVSRFQMPGTDLADVQNLYINIAEDEREADELLSLVRSNLQDRGYQVMVNSGSVTFDNGDYIFDYAPDWHWDTSWYLVDFRVAIYEPGENTLLAQAHSQQATLVRKSMDVIVERALASLFDDAPENTGEEP